MIIGKKSAILKSNKPNIACPKCHKNSLSIQIFGDYGHLFQIPFISKGKRGVALCSSCNEIVPHQEMNNELKLAFYELKEQCKIPFWFYGGFIAIKIWVIYRIIFINP